MNLAHQLIPQENDKNNYKNLVDKAECLNRNSKIIWEKLATSHEFNWLNFDNFKKKNLIQFGLILNFVAARGTVAVAADGVVPLADRKLPTTTRQRFRIG